MHANARVDVVMNIFAKPYQTALAIVSLLRSSGQHIHRFFLQFEPAGSRYDTVPPYAMAEWLGDRCVAFQPEVWIECDAVDPAQLYNTPYRLALRYQSAFEHSDRPFLFVMHNDVLIKKDIIGTLLKHIDTHIAVGHIGQCWNCPASHPELVRAAGLGDTPCTPETYLDFKPDADGLRRLYAAARKANVFVRPYWEGWDAAYTAQAWPLPECRVNEWGALINLEKTRPLVQPHGHIMPFGAYEACGSTCLDIDVAWFRDLHRQGLTAKHVPLDPLLTHFVGSFRMTRKLHLQAEEKAKSLLERNFPDFVNWCRTNQNGLF